MTKKVQHKPYTLRLTDNRGIQEPNVTHYATRAEAMSAFGAVTRLGAGYRVDVATHRAVLLGPDRDTLPRPVSTVGGF